MRATSKELRDSVFGSGCLQYSWWRSFKLGMDGIAPGEQPVVVTYDSPEGEGWCTSAVSDDDLFAAARKVVAEDTNWPKYQGPSASTIEQAALLLYSASNADLDADTADQLLQVAVLGSVIYG